MKKNILKLLSAFLLFAVLSCNVNSRFTNPSEYIRYAGQVNGGGGGSGQNGGKVVYNTLTINILGDGYVIANSDKYVSELKFVKGTKVRIEAIADGGNQFQAWRGSISSEKQVEEIVMNSNMSIVASFVVPADKQILFVNIGRNGSVEIDGVLHENTTDSLLTIKKEYENTQSVKLKAIPKDDTFIFAGWSGSVNSIEEEITVPLTDISTVLASFDSDEKVLAISVTPEGYGYIEVSIDGASPVEYSDVMYIQKGSKVQIEAKLNDTRKYEFLKWNGSIISEDEVITIDNFDSDISLIAEFKQVMKTLIININDKSYGNITVDGTTYTEPRKIPIDNEVVIIATRSKDYAFEKWSGDANTTARQITVKIDNNKTLNADFIAPLQVYNDTDMNGYNASYFDTWNIKASFSSKEVPTYTFYNYKNAWTKTSQANLNEYIYRGENSLVDGSVFTKVTLTEMDYYLYKGVNLYIEDSSDFYNNDIIKRFYFYRFKSVGKTIKGNENLDNALCAVDTYTKFIYSYSVPGNFTSILGFQKPNKWFAIELTNKSSSLKFYEYDPIGYVNEDGSVVLFDSFKNTQESAANSGKTDKYFPKATATAEVVKHGSPSKSVGRSPYY